MALLRTTRIKEFGKNLRGALGRRVTPYRPPPGPAPKSPCSTCRWSELGVYKGKCKGGIDVRNPGPYFTRSFWARNPIYEVWPKNGGNCPSWLTRKVERARPLNHFAAVRFNDENVVTLVVPITSEIGDDEALWFLHNANVWLVDMRKSAEPVVGAVAVFENGTRQASKRAELRWREPKHKYGTDDLGRTRHATAEFRSTQGLR